MATVYLLKFNNYYNRIAKPLIAASNSITVDDFLDAGATLLESYQNINFNPNDGINTELIVNYAMEGLVNPDYLFVTGDQQNSRWFVTDAVRTRRGQYQLTLKRDTVAELYPYWKRSPVFIEKATLPSNNPLIFNPEDIAVNQILRSQTPLKDKTGVSWIVGYCDKHKQDQEWDAQELTYTPDIQDSTATYASKDAFIQAVCPKPIVGKFELEIDTKNDGKCYRTHFDFNDGSRFARKDRHTSFSSYFNYDMPTDPTNANVEIKNEMINMVLDKIANDYNTSKYSTYKTIKDTWNGKYIIIAGVKYKVEFDNDITNGTKTTLDEGSYLLNSTNIWLGARQVMAEYYGKSPTTMQYSGDSAKLIYLEAYAYTPKVTLTKIYDGNCKFKMSLNRRALTDNPYCMFAIPYTDLDGKELIFKINGTNNTNSSTVAMGIATEMIRLYGESLYDLQVLPYCPFQNEPLTVLDDGSINLLTADSGVKWTAINNASNNPVSFVYYCNSSSGTFDIDYSIEWDGTKTQILTEAYRLCSPNYSGAYELKVFENNGIEYFNVDFTYLPYQPWIKINPNFRYLNGIDANDDRGLILGGNFSITRVSDAWANYQLQNVNYQSQFDRQVKNIKINNKWQYRQTISGAIAGTVTAASQGALAGGFKGGAFGSLVGGSIGGALGAGGGIADIYSTKKLQHEALDYTKDLFGLNLQNIQAQPETLAKITAFNINSKYFPYVEFYSCTDEEKVAVENKLKYNGMNVGVIGKLEDYITDDQSYIKGQLIRLEASSTSFDFHELNDLARELYEGVFISTPIEYEQEVED